MGRSPRLSKSRFQLGLQCPKALWLRCYRPELAGAVSEVQQAIFDQGHRVGAVARECFPDGVLVREDYRQSAAAIATTRRHLAGDWSCLFEAAFTYDDLFVRPDVLVRLDDGSCHLIEVKSSTGMKPEHVTDAAVQRWVLEGAGLAVSRVSLLHLDSTYLYPGGPYDLDALFALEDITVPVAEYLPCVPGEVARLRATLQAGCPDVLIGRQCAKPYACAFVAHCHEPLPDFPVTELPRVDAELLATLLREGILSLRDVPPDYPGLTPAQRETCAIVQSGEPWFDPALASALDGLVLPAHFLDFETWGSALPVFPGTTPYQQVPVQWSLHTLAVDGALVHREYLHAEATDPRGAIADSLLEALGGDDGPVVVYTDYEHRVLAALADALPDRAADLRALLPRLFDLHALVKRYVRHPGFRGRTSLKVVLPALADDVTYEELAVRDGATATLRYEAATRGGLSESERGRIFADLRAYCAVDTLALVRVVQALAEQAGISLRRGPGATAPPGSVPAAR